MATVTEEPQVLTTAGVIDDSEIEPDEDILYEVVDGRIVEKLVGSNEVDLANWIADFMRDVARPNLLGRVVVEMQFVLDEKRRLRRCPDLAFVSVERWPSKNSPVRKRAFWSVVPDLAVEIVSPSNRTAEDMAKVLEYFRYGVRKVWIVFPRLGFVHVYSSPTDVRILSIENADVLDGEDILPGFRLPLTTVFENEPGLDATE